MSTMNLPSLQLHLALMKSKHPSLSIKSEKSINFCDIKSDDSSNHSEYATHLSSRVPAINQPIKSKSENKNEYFDHELNTDINVDDNMAILHPKRIYNSTLSNCHFETTNSNPANYNYINKVSQSNTLSTLQSNQTSETGLSFSYDSSLSRNSERATNFYDIKSDNSSNHSKYATYLSSPVSAINQPIESRSENRNEYFDRELNTDINIDDNMAILDPKHIYDSTLSNCHFETTNSNPANYNYINKVSQSNTLSTLQSNQTSETGLSFSYDSSLSRNSERATNFYDIKSDNSSNHSEYATSLSSPVPAINQPIESRSENKNEYFDRELNTDINVDDNMAILHPKHIYNSTLNNCHFETTNSNPANYNYINKVSQFNTSSTWESNQTFDTGHSFSYDSSLPRSSETGTNFYDIKSDNSSNHSEYIRHFNSPVVNQPIKSERENEHGCFDHRLNTDIYNNWIRETMNQTNQDSEILQASRMSSILKATQNYHIASKLDSNYSNLPSLSKKTTNSYEAMSEGDFAHDLTGPMEIPQPVQTISPHKPIGSKIGDNTYHFLGETSKMDIDSTLPCLDSYTNTKHQYTCSLCQKRFNKTSHLKVHWRKHSGERPYHCTWQNCNKNFTRSDELKRHERTHTGERNHSCSKCEKKFTRSDHLKKHIKTHRHHEMEEMEVDMNEGYDVTKNPFTHF